MMKTSEVFPMIDRDEMSRLVRGKNVLLIHHWDADGICSGAMLLSELGKMGAGKVENEVPRLGEYEMDREWLEERGRNGPGILVTADICIPLPNMLAMRDSLAVDLIMFDHHSRDPVSEDGIHFVNPTSLRGEDWPSNTLVLSDFFSRGPDLLTVMGLVGDKGTGIERYGDIWPGFLAHLEKLGSDLQEIAKIVDLLDSCYKSGRREEVKKWPWKLLGKDDGEILRTVEEDPDLAGFDEDIERKMDELFSGGLEDRGDYLMRVIDTDYHVVSALTRRFSATNPDREVMVINRGIFASSSQLYLRSRRLDLRPLIGMVHSMGQSAGGKMDVLGSVIDNAELDNVVERLGRELPALESVQ